jgi:hypothetical protein
VIPPCTVPSSQSNLEDACKGGPPNQPIVACHDIEVTKPGTYGALSLGGPKCNTKKRAATGSFITITLLSGQKVIFESLTIGKDQGIRIEGGEVIVTGTLTMGEGSEIVKSSTVPPMSVGCVVFEGKVFLTLDATNTPSVKFFSITQPQCKFNISNAPTEFTLVNSADSSTCYTTSNPQFDPIDGTLKYTATQTACPAPAKEDLGWIAAIVIGILLIVVLILAWRYREKIKDKCRGGASRKESARTTSTPGNRDTTADIPAPPFTVTAIADYTAVDTTQMSLTKGVQYEVVRVAEGNYWFQSKKPNGKLGWFPASYARIESE